MVQRLPDPGLPEERTAYLAMLDQALLDRHISVWPSQPGRCVHLDRRHNN